MKSRTRAWRPRGTRINSGFSLTTKGKAWERKERARIKRDEERALLRAVRERLEMLESDWRPSRARAMSSASQVLSLLFKSMNDNPSKSNKSGFMSMVPPVTLEDWCPVDCVNRSADFAAQITTAGEAEADKQVYVRMATIMRDTIPDFQATLTGRFNPRSPRSKKEPLVVFSIAEADGLNMRASFTVPVDMLLQAMVHVNAEPPTPRGTRNLNHVNVWLEHPWLRHQNDWQMPDPTTYPDDSKEGKES